MPLPSPEQPGVLIVGQETSILLFLFQALAHHGLAAWTASGVEDAAGFYREHHEAVRAVLLDARLPGADPAGTLTALREVNPAVRCCLIAGPAYRHAEAGLHAPGAVEVLRRPFGFGRLLHTLLRLAGPLPGGPGLGQRHA